MAIPEVKTESYANAAAYEADLATQVADGWWPLFSVVEEGVAIVITYRKTH